MSALLITMMTLIMNYRMGLYGNRRKTKANVGKNKRGKIDDGNNEILLKVHHNIKCQESRDVIDTSHFDSMQHRITFLNA